MTPERLFYWTMIDLEACLRTPWQYHQMRIAALLRLLIFDRNEDPLLTQLQKAGRSFEPSFRIAGAGELKSIEPWESSQTEFSQVPVDPEAPPGGSYSPIELDLSAFSARIVCRANGIPITLRELVEHVGYVSGLVHAGTPKDKKRKGDAALLHIRRTIRFGGNFEVSLVLLKQIGQVVYRALMPFLIQLNEVANRGFPIGRFDFERQSGKELGADGKWRLHSLGNEIVISNGYYSPSDPLHANAPIAAGQPYLQFDMVNQVWRAYGRRPPRVEDASADELFVILTRHAQRLR